MVRSGLELTVVKDRTTKATIVLADATSELTAGAESINSLELLKRQLGYDYLTLVLATLSHL